MDAKWKYSKEIYPEAKTFMIKHIEAYDDTRYLYGNYCFYENLNYIIQKNRRHFPTAFTMAGFNDNLNTLVFLGFQDGYQHRDEKYKTNIKEHWASFIDEYYGKYHDFSD